MFCYKENCECGNKMDYVANIKEGESVEFLCLCGNSKMISKNDKKVEKIKNEIMKDMTKNLLNIGGDKVYCQINPDTEKTLTDGSVYDFSEYNRERHLMKANECHRNTANLWMELIMKDIPKECLDDMFFDLADYIDDNNPRYFIATGYVLTKGAWISHSFILEGEDKIIETTVVNTNIFFGEILNGLDCLDFSDNYR